MALGVRGKLFLISMLLMLAVGLAALLFLEPGLRSGLETRIQGELERHAATARVLVEVSPTLDGIADADPLADELGSAAGARVTIVALDGRVLGDSKQTAVQLRTLENHRNRPEILAAHARGQGVARRYSTTLRTEMLFVAQPFERADLRGVVRVAMPLSEVDEVIDSLRFFIFLGGMVGLIVAIFMSVLASVLASRSLGPLVDHARRLSGDTGRREHDELELIAGSFNQLAQDLEGTLDAFAQERDRLETILGNMSEALIALDADDRVQLINSAARELLGVEAVETGTPAVELVRAPGFAELLPRVRKQRGASAEFTLATEPPRIVLARAAWLEATSGVVLVMLDVTEMRHLENVRRDFVANVSHELRTPISIIRANAETLLDGAMSDSERGPRFAHSIVRSAERLGLIVSDLLELSRIESDERPLGMRQLPLEERVEQNVESLQIKARARSITLVDEVSGELDVMADELALDQILTNLLDNAIKYTPEGGTVSVRARRSQDVEGMVE
ncbi:MAG: PAS domain-containing protein, partial [Myxococcales bacterium]|nr:PAS domain-containing protein [Myxococcales bacterium]